MAGVTPLPVRALVRWQHAAGSLWPYVAATPFLSGSVGAAPRPGVTLSLTLSHRGRGDAAPPALLRGSLEEQPAFFLDLPPLQTLSWAQALNRNGLLVVPVFHRWGAEPCLLPVTGLVQQLVACAQHLRRPARPSGAVFLLDSERSGPAGTRKTLSRFDNRYRYGPNVFPTGAFLMEQGITRTVLLSDGPPRQDLWPYLEGLRAAGLSPELLEV